jgi:hypothetical protein
MVTVSSSTSPAARAWRITSAPPMTETSRPPAASLAAATASPTPAANRNPLSGGGASSSRWVTTNMGTPKGFRPPQAPVTS